MAYDFKKEEDVKEYLKNLFTEYSFGCLSEKKPEVCHLLGEYYEKIKKDNKKSIEIYKRNCDVFDYGLSCSMYARFRVTGDDCKKDMPIAFQYMKKACKLDDGSGCLHAALMTMASDDIGVDKNEVRAEGMEMMNKACFELNEPKSCALLGAMYLSGKVTGVERNLLAAYKSFLKSCEFGHAFSCLKISQMHAHGNGVEKNQELADTFRERAEDLEKQAKNFQGIQFQQGT